jgi:predicted ATPase
MLLVDRWGQVQNGFGHVVLLSGEAGIGKSRLVQVLKDHIATVSHTRLECRSSPYYQNTALYPITDLFQRTLAWAQDDPVKEKLHKLEQALGRYDLGTEITVPLFAALLSLPLSEDRYPPLDLTPQQIRQKLLETLVAILVEESERQPVVFIIEDLHWTDPTTLELLDLLIDQSATAAILTLLTCRPEFQPSWSHRSHVAAVSLSRLSQRQIEWMAERVAKGKRLPNAVLQEIVEKTDGVPLFVEEIVKAAVESGGLQEHDDHYDVMGLGASLTIPTTLHDSLMARLDRLANAKGVAQIGAVIGRQFSYALLQAVIQIDAANLQRELDQLVKAELVSQRGLPPQATYLFKHALIQDAAYQSLLRRTRQQYHQRIAEVLETQFSETTETQPELLATHYTKAGLNEQAVGYWYQAGQKASERSAYVEAIAHLTTGLELVKTLPDTWERVEHELALQITLGTALAAGRHYGAPEVGEAFLRAQALCQRVGDTPQLFRVLLGLRRFYFVRGELRTAHEFEHQLLTLAQNRQDPTLLLEAHRTLGATLYFFGAFAAARTHLEQGLALYDPQQHRSLALLHGADPGVVCGTWASVVLWYVGYPDQALARSYEACTLAQEVSHPVSLGMALALAPVLHQLRREKRVAQEKAETVIALATAHGFTFREAQGRVIWGWALATQGAGEEGIAQIRQGLADFRGMEAGSLVPYYLSLLAEAYTCTGQVAEGLCVLVEALSLVHRTEERNTEAELHRLKGQLLLHLSSDNQAEAASCFHHALATARHQQAKSLELRAATSLARLWQSQDKRKDAYDLLAPVYNWFTEGFDTADLLDAKGLLDELRAEISSPTA